MYINNGTSAENGISGEKLYTNINLTPSNDTLNTTQNVTLPNNTHIIRIEYANLSTVSSDAQDGHLTAYYLNTTPTKGLTIDNYLDNIIGARMIYFNSTDQITPGNLTFNSTNPNITSLIITDSNLNGNIKIYTT